MPNDVPPRPGAPGYDEFLIHQQGKDTPPPAAGSADAAGSAPAPANAPAPVVAPVERTSAQTAPAAKAAPNDQAAVQGGLY